MFGDFAMYLVKFSIITLQGQERRKKGKYWSIDYR